MPEHAAAVEPAYRRAMANEVQTIIDGIPAEDLATQWGVCIELLGEEGGMPVFMGDPRAYVLEVVTPLTDLTSEKAEVGFHRCYGDPLKRSRNCSESIRGLPVHQPRSNAAESLTS